MVHYVLHDKFESGAHAWEEIYGPFFFSPAGRAASFLSLKEPVMTGRSYSRRKRAGQCGRDAAQIRPDQYTKT